MEPFTRLTSRVVVLAVDNIDADQIIPTSFLKTTDRTGLGASLFADWRYLPDGQPDPKFVLNHPQSQGAQVLLVGDNFGCGSSREHAAWALLGWGFRAVISTSFADIFRNNALKNGLLPVAVPPEVHPELVRLLKHDPSQTVTIDLETQTMRWKGGETHFPIDPFSKDCLLRGVDELGYLLSLEPQIAAYEAKRFSG
ncbi:MAG: 3-isopropylmalate dehydratase small subunit [Thermanaerothrix sp.]|nr:3-isopropylmalate dehydratase small subunit [Thermanaerothrix sp.]